MSEDKKKCPGCAEMLIDVDQNNDLGQKNPLQNFSVRMDKSVS